ncbi:DUF2254 domain-containing protein [Filobacillus milosensis]|uniref:DUF2254 domain-containing protein n=1 Tax=Filobacillus milosensis TaxID=94137 RepID=A0A4Y8IMG6_9BACI|nr:DUF2254 domain-containing protein [Filobacillus milosensis]TFB21391.1 DUF2254 domain-containing protein [Filobacillus milosensis]
MNKGKVWIQVRDSFWFLPAIYSIFSLLAVAVISYMDQWVLSAIKNDIPAIFLTEKAVAQTIYGSMVTAILTMTTISFSTIMVVLSTYSTQFSPRTLQDFMKSRVTQHVLSVFSFGFIFSLVNLFLLGKDKSSELFSPFFTILVSIVCLAFFLLFIHHSSRFLKVNNLIGTIRSSTSNLIQKTFKEKEYHEYCEWSDSDLNQLEKDAAKVIKAKKSGYVQSIQFKSLIDWAQQNDVVLEANIFVGEYIQNGMDLFYYWGKEDDEKVDLDGCLQCVLVGNERVDTQDVEFSIQKLVEIAVRAISPSLNDPHTATNCINRIGSLLIELGSVYEPIRYFADDDENLRIIVEPLTFQEYLYKSFYQIRLYGYHDISVMNSVIEVLYKMAHVHGEKIEKDVWRFGKYMIKAVDVEKMDELDFNHFNNQVQKLATACGEEIQLR